MFTCILEGTVGGVYEFAVVGSDNSKGDEPVGLVGGECVSVSLAVQCVGLPPLSLFAGYDRDDAVEVECYNDVASINLEQVFSAYVRARECCIGIWCVIGTCVVRW